MCGTPAGGGHHPELCEEGLLFYRNALAHGTAWEDAAPACLSALELLVPSPHAPGTLVPVPPSVAASALTMPMERAIQERQQQVSALRAVMSQAQAVYLEEQQRRETGVQRLVGAAVINAALDEAAQATTQELLTAQPGGGRPEDILKESLKRVRATRRQGVAQRTLYQHTVRTHGPTLEYIQAASEAGVEFRTMDEMFDRLLIFDRAVAFIPDMEGDRADHALMIRHPGAVHYLASVFSHAWERAEPLTYVADRPRPKLLTDEIQLRVLRLMVDGYTDAAIAGRLGMSTRTVATHMKKASDRLGSKSRAQLAYLIAQTGLLDESPAEGHCDCDAGT